MLDFRTSFVVSVIWSFSRSVLNKLKADLAYSVSQKNPPLRFSDIFPKRMGIFNQFLHTHYTFLSTLDYKFLFSYLQLWSYAILSATTQQIFTFHYKFNF